MKDERKLEREGKQLCEDNGWGYRGLYFISGYGDEEVWAIRIAVLKEPEQIRSELVKADG